LQDSPEELTALADHVAHQRDELVRSWQSAVQRDPHLTEGDSPPRSELIDHIPALLAAFERTLRQAATNSEESAHFQGEATAAGHGLQRWKRGYNLREVPPANWASSTTVLSWNSALTAWSIQTFPYRPSYAPNRSTGLDGPLQPIM
jgi:hypothetical protein